MCSVSNIDKNNTITTFVDVNLVIKLLSYIKSASLMRSIFIDVV